MSYGISFFTIQRIQTRKKITNQGEARAVRIKTIPSQIIQTTTQITTLTTTQTTTKLQATIQTIIQILMIITKKRNEIILIQIPEKKGEARHKSSELMKGWRNLKLHAEKHRQYLERGGSRRWASQSGDFTTSYRPWEYD